MRVKPILFSPPMVRAIRENRKLQTRRTITKAIPDLVELLRDDTENAPDSVFIHDAKCPSFCDFSCGGEIVKAPYQPGDVLRVREPWRAPKRYDHLKPRDIPVGTPTFYEADGSPEVRSDEVWGKPRLGRFMCAWMAREFVLVKAVRAERVQDITEADAIAEGLTPDLCSTIFDRAAGRVDMKTGYYLRLGDRDSGDTYCDRCIAAAHKKHGGEVIAEHMPEVDSPRWCETCGSLLEHTLTDYGVDEELGIGCNPEDDMNWVSPVSGGDARILAALAWNQQYDKENRHRWGRIARIAFPTLWDSIHGPGAWHRNDWVWAYTFSRTTKPEGLE